MRKPLEIKIGSAVYKHINTVRMSEAERLVAVNAMQNADLVVDVFVWASKKIEQLAARLFLRPSLKH